jgi:putative sterol carrier protein
MSIINQPQDILGLGIKSILEPVLEDEKILKKIKKFNKVVVMELTGLYPISLTFKKGLISIDYGEKPKYDIKLIVSVDAFTGMAEGNGGLISSFLKGKIRVKKMHRIFTILKFTSIFLPAVEKATEKPILENLYNLL